MKLISETAAISRLEEIREDLRRAVLEGYEHRAKKCAECETPGACCLDAHFVNVRITRLEAVAIRSSLAQLPDEQRESVRRRIRAAIENYNLSDPTAAEDAKYACPLFEKGKGCLVHETAKPLPCIAHACYERREDEPPDALLAIKEDAIGRLNQRVYGQVGPFASIPVAIAGLGRRL